LLGPATEVSEDRDNEAMSGVSADVGGAGEASGLACEPNRVGAPKREFPSDWTSVESYTEPSVNEPNTDQITTPTPTPKPTPHSR
jgi:hypothetical protein